MSAFADARELIAHSESSLKSIRKLYEASLHAKKINGALQVEIKNFVENLRSALDFSAGGVFHKWGSSTKANPRIYFPYANLDQDRPTFVKSGRIDTCIPGISAKPDIVKSLLEMQHFGTRGYSWLPEFMQLTNENKHRGLTPQVRNESRELRISGDGASIGLGEGASISMGPGASISVGCAIIQGGQTFGVDKPPRVEGGKVETITWVSFSFDSNGRAVLPFLETALKGTREIVDELSQK